MGAFVQGKASRSAVNLATFTFTFAGANTLGNSILAAVFCANAGGVVPIWSTPFSGSGGNSYRQIGSGWAQVVIGVNTWFIQLYQANIKALPAGNIISLTATLTAVQGRIAIAALEASAIQNQVASSPDVASIVSATNPNSAAVILTPTIRLASEFAVVGLIGATALTAGSGWTLITPTADNCTLAYNPTIAAGSSPVTPATLASGAWAASMGAFLPSLVDSGSLAAIENSSVAAAHPTQVIYVDSGPLIAIHNSSVVPAIATVAGPTPSPRHPKKNNWPGGWPGGG